MKSKLLKINKNAALRYSIYGDPNQPLDKIHSNYFPTGFKDYITICVDSDYPFWDDVLEVVLPTLYMNKVGIVAISASGKANYKSCQNANNIELRHAAYLIEKSKLHISGQDWSYTLAQNNGKDLALVIEDKDPASFFIEPACEAKVLKGTEENPEIIIKEIFRWLGIEQEIGIETKLIGPSYGPKILELIPDFELVRPPNVGAGYLITVRCDLHENWEFVAKLLTFGISPVVTCIGLPKKPILGFLGGIQSLNILVNEETKEKDIRNIEACGIPYTLLSSKKEINEIKRALFDLPPIKFIENWGENNLDKLNALDYDTRIRSNRLVASGSGTFLSFFHWKQNLPVSDTKGTLLLDGPEDPLFLEESDLFYYYQ